MHMLGYLLWIALSILLASHAAKRMPASGSLRMAIGLLLAVVLILSPFWDVILGAPTFNRICRTEAGLVRNEATEFPLTSIAVNDLALSQCYDCLVLLVMGAAAETQADIRKATNPLALTNRPGPVSYKLTDAPGPACAPFNAAFASPLGRTELWQAADKRDDGLTCIVGSDINEISADYELIGPRTVQEQRGLIVVQSRIALLRRRGDDRPLATLTHFRQLSWIGRKTALPPLRSCPEFEYPSTGDNFTVVTLVKGLMQYRTEGSQR